MNKNRFDTILKLLSILFLMINAGIVGVFVLMFYAAFTGDGSVVININNFNEMLLEAYIVMPIIFIMNILVTIYTVNYLRRSL